MQSLYYKQSTWKRHETEYIPLLDLKLLKLISHSARQHLLGQIAVLGPSCCCVQITVTGEQLYQVSLKPSILSNCALKGESREKEDCQSNFHDGCFYPQEDSMPRGPGLVQEGMRIPPLQEWCCTNPVSAALICQEMKSRYFN